jgi:hypothetical protein
VQGVNTNGTVVGNLDLMEIHVPQVVNVPGDEPVVINRRKSSGPRIQRVQQPIDGLIWRSFTW